MSRLRKRGEEIRHFILGSIENKSKDVIALTIEKFKISRQAVYKHIKHLEEQGTLVHLKKGVYELHPQETWSLSIALGVESREDVVWRTIVREKIGLLPDNAIAIWQYGFTEMFNNVIDHSESKNVQITIQKTAYSTEMYIEDTGIGIFNKIKQGMNLLDERHAVLELTKGKLTTDPDNHTGEGIFFTSRMFDEFSILSGEVFLSHSYGKDEDWILQSQKNHLGTLICMKLRNNTSRETKQIFDKFTSLEGDFGFTKTVVPVRLAQYGNEKLISRSQAKRLLERIDRFKTVLFDFREVDSIGQAFADEVFRVFKKQHPYMDIIPINANEPVTQMINRVESVEENTTFETHTASDVNYTKN
ncbi:MAG: ArsR family transcriptional regulator [Nitrospirae bacterium RBG_13_39_12]|nr:MAG: ArsR family transcriptional regulator [Nitrospirae bacterium RBG_13_39_12]